MKTKSIVIGLALVVIGAGGCFVRRERDEAAARYEAMQATTTRQAELRRANLVARDRIDALASRRRELEAALRPPRPTPAVLAPVAQVLDPKVVAAFAKTPFRDIALEKNPELQARYLASRRAEMMGKYGALWAKLGLNEAQIDRFLANVNDATAREMDINATRRAQGLAEDDPVVAKLRAEATERTAAAQRELLGEAGFRRLEEYEAELPARSAVDGIATTCVFLDAPLSPEQADKLTRVMLEANVGYRRDGHAETPYVDVLRQRPAREVVDSAQVLEQSRAFLTPDQHALLEMQLTRMPLVYRLVNLLHESSPDPVNGFVFGRGP